MRGGITAAQVVTIQDESNRRYYCGELVALPSYDGLALLVAKNHVANIQMWHNEDHICLRVDGRTSCPRQMWNRIRNQTIMEMDRAFDRINGGDDAELQTDSPGMVVDRLSVLLLKSHHGLSVAADRLALASAFESYLEGLRSGRKRFRLVRQDKMYAGSGPD